MGDDDLDIVIKGELHSSREDHIRELNLIKSGTFDAVVFESADPSTEEESGGSVAEYLISFTLFIMSPLYVANKPTYVATNRADADMYFTRKSDAGIINGLPTPLPTIVSIVAISLLMLCVIFAVPSGRVNIFGISTHSARVSLVFYTLILGLPVLVRILRGKSSGESNTDRIIAKEIIDANQESGRTLAILGNDHAAPVESHINELSPELTVEPIEPEYGRGSAQGVSELLRGLVPVSILLAGTWLVVNLFAETVLRWLANLLGVL